VITVSLYSSFYFYFKSGSRNPLGRSPIHNLISIISMVGVVISVFFLISNFGLAWGILYFLFAFIGGRLILYPTFNEFHDRFNTLSSKRWDEIDSFDNEEFEKQRKLFSRLYFITLAGLILLPLFMILNLIF